MLRRVGSKASAVAVVAPTALRISTAAVRTFCFVSPLFSRDRGHLPTVFQPSRYFDEVSPLFDPFFSPFSSLLSSVSGPQAEARSTDQGIELDLEIPRFKPDEVKVDVDAT